MKTFYWINVFHTTNNKNVAFMNYFFILFHKSAELKVISCLNLVW